jgi:hypothetical protein
MSTRRTLICLAALLIAWACHEGTAPSSFDGAEPHFLKWSGDAAPRFTATGGLEGSATTRTGQEPTELALSTIALDAYRASVWAVRGKERRLQLDYVSPNGTSPFLLLEIEGPTMRPDGSTIAWGDSVLVTAIVDPENIRVSLEPTGLQFSSYHPAELKMWWTGANGDLNGDGLVDGQDAEIETQWLGLWFQEGTGSPWTQIPAEKSVSEKRLKAYLKHFSGYAVSW